MKVIRHEGYNTKQRYDRPPIECAITDLPEQEAAVLQYIVDKRLFGGMNILMERPKHRAYYERHINPVNSLRDLDARERSQTVQLPSGEKTIITDYDLKLLLKWIKQGQEVILYSSDYDSIRRQRERVSEIFMASKLLIIAKNNIP